MDDSPTDQNDGAPRGAPPPPAVSASTPPPRRSGKKRVAVVIVFFTIPAVIWISALIVVHRQHENSKQLTAARERQSALPFTDLRVPHGVAVDAAGNVYVADALANRVLKLAAGTNIQTVLPFTGLDLSAGVDNVSTAGVAVDSAANVYVTDTGHNRVLELPAKSNTQRALAFHALDFPQGVAVDSAGTVYVADNSRVVKLAAGSSTQTLLPSTGEYVYPQDVAVDTSGTVYVRSHAGKHFQLLKLAPGSDSWTKLPSVGGEEFVAVDTAGTVYVIRSGGGVMKLAPGSSDWTELPGNHRFVDPQGLAVDSRGNVYVTDHTGDRQPVTFGSWTIFNAKSHGFVLRLPTG
jgi:sugar lactone lactonase YvrE